MFQLHQFDLLPVLGFGGGTPVAQILGSFEKDTINTTAIIKVRNFLVQYDVLMFQNDVTPLLTDRIYVCLVEGFGGD